MHEPRLAYACVMQRRFAIKGQRPVFLITGFGPFPGIDSNATSRLVPELVAEAHKRNRNTVFIGEVLPTEWQAAPERLTRLFNKHRPSFALHFGVARDAKGFRLESRALNVCRMTPDATGALPPSERVQPGGPDCHHVRWPTDLILKRLTDNGLPAATSDDAGGYLCNAILYRSLAVAAAATQRHLGGFVHIPADLTGPPLTYDDALRGGHLIIDCMIEALTLAR